MVQGNIKQATLSSSNADSIIKLIITNLKGRVLERYTDTNTESIAISSSQIHASAISGKHRLNLQAAIHRDTVSGEWRLTLGTPVITSEY